MLGKDVRILGKVSRTQLEIVSKPVGGYQVYWYKPMRNHFSQYSAYIHSQVAIY